MPSLEKRNDIYRIVLRFAGRKFSRSLFTKSESTARLALARLEDNLRRLEEGLIEIGPDENPLESLLPSTRPTTARSESKTPLTVKSLLANYIDSIPEGSIEPATIRMLETHAKHLQKFLKPNTRTTDLGLAELQKFVERRGKCEGRHKQKLSAVTIRKELATLYAACAWAIESGQFDGALPSRKRLRFPKGAEKPPFRTRDEIERLLANTKLSHAEIKNTWQCIYLNQAEIIEVYQTVRDSAPLKWLSPMVLFAAHTGARRSELIRSRREDIDLENGSAIIREKKRVRGQNSTRTVPLSPLLCQILNEYLSQNPIGPSTFSISGKELSKSQAHKYFKRSLRNSCWSVLSGWHVLRHSFISNCASKGIDQRMIDAWVGHTTEEMRRRYRHLFPDSQRQALASVFGSSTNSHIS